MKKIMLLLIALFCITGFAFAQEEATADETTGDAVVDEVVLGYDQIIIENQLLSGLEIHEVYICSLGEELLAWTHNLLKDGDEPIYAGSQRIFDEVHTLNTRISKDVDGPTLAPQKEILVLSFDEEDNAYAQILSYPIDEDEALIIIIE